MIKDEQDILSSSGVERSAVNRFVVGSNPTWGDNSLIKFNLNKLRYYNYRLSKYRKT